MLRKISPLNQKKKKLWCNSDSSPLPQVWPSLCMPASEQWWMGGDVLLLASLQSHGEPKEDGGDTAMRPPTSSPTACSLLYGKLRGIGHISHILMFEPREELGGSDLSRSCTWLMCCTMKGYLLPPLRLTVASHVVGVDPPPSLVIFLFELSCFQFPLLPTKKSYQTLSRCYIAKTS
ncbi:hypothetical protein I3760_12G052500 [Carya illinoinensis]|nr:hypothetical protein I3760_12G052500 [Carya illinoinensis]